MAHFKARSHDPILRIWFLVPKIESRRSDGLISRFRFCGENVGRSFVVCLHDPIFRTSKESSIWRQNYHGDIMQNLSAPFIFQEVCRMKIALACSISIRFFKTTDPCVGRSCSMCSHDPIFGTNKNRILKNGSCEGAFTSPPVWTSFKTSSGLYIGSHDGGQLLSYSPFCHTLPEDPSPVKNFLCVIVWHHFRQLLCCSDSVTSSDFTTYNYVWLSLAMLWLCNDFVLVMVLKSSLKFTAPVVFTLNIVWKQRFNSL